MLLRACGAPPKHARRCSALALLPRLHTLTGSLHRAVQITHVVPTQSKEVDDVLGGEEAWRNVDATSGAQPVRERQALQGSCHLLPAAVCPKCSHNKAFFMQVQIRSGDEPMTTFYKARSPRRLRCASAESRTLQCVACKHQWREG